MSISAWSARSGTFSVNDLPEALEQPMTTTNRLAAEPTAVGASERRPVPRKRRESGLTNTRLWLWRIFLVVAFVVCWELASGRIVSELMVSRPTAVAERLWTWITDGTLGEHILVTAQATGLGFALGAGAGMLVGYITASFRRFGDVVEPAMTALYTMPRLALAPLFILWFGLGMQFRVIFASVIVFFLVYFNTHFGVKDVKGELIAAVRLMGASRREVAIKVVIPSALVWVAAGFKLSVPYALIGVVVGEMLASDQGLGYLLQRSANQFNASGTFATIITLLVIALLLDFILTRLTGRFLGWRSKGALNPL
ncbi:MAG: ABC transporter permease subunit [Micromonosporaceae bacterium]|nr:ABC transporter permease subunit [Micromonosporaceae bacterium]